MRGSGALAITGYEGKADEVEWRRGAVSAVLRALPAEPDPSAGADWFDDRYKGPYLRDALLGAGALVETLETATFWSGVERLYHDVGGALRESIGRGPRVSWPTLRIGYDAVTNLKYSPIDPVALLARAAAAVRSGKPEPEYPWVSRFADASTEPAQKDGATARVTTARLPLEERTRRS